MSRRLALLALALFVLLSLLAVRDVEYPVGDVDLDSRFSMALQTFIGDRIPEGSTIFVKHPVAHRPLFPYEILEQLERPDDLLLVERLGEGRQPCDQAMACDIEGRPLFILMTAPTDDRGPLVALAQVANHDGDPMDPMIVANSTSVFGPSSATRYCNMSDPNAGSLTHGTRLTGGYVWFDCAGPPMASTTFMHWFARGCVGLEDWYICSDRYEA
jgi:hypothetical protein